MLHHNSIQQIPICAVLMRIYNICANTQLNKVLARNERIIQMKLSRSQRLEHFYLFYSRVSCSCVLFVFYIFVNNCLSFSNFCLIKSLVIIVITVDMTTRCVLGNAPTFNSYLFPNWRQIMFFLRFYRC